jgi:glycosyltransferase involved in cell wall biosynthesis
MTPLVSILIPAYNAERWIGDTIQSALAQTWPRTEIIIVDDGSRDRTLRVARQFASRNVSVVTQENQGASAARNRAFELCQGDYIQWLDADDLLSPDKVGRQIAAAEESQDKRRLFSSAWGYFIYRPYRAQFLPTPLWRDLSPVEWLLRKMGQGLHMQTATWLVSRELTEAAGRWDPRLSLDDDGEYFCRVIRACNAISFISKAKVFYRQVGFGSLSCIDRSSGKFESLFLSMNLHIQYLRSLENSERTRLACLNYIRTWLHQFYLYRPDIVEELKKITLQLGGQFEQPRLSWKYNWMVKRFGWVPAKRAQLLLPKLKASFINAWDRVLFSLEGGNLASSRGLPGGKSSG